MTGGPAAEGGARPALLHAAPDVAALGRSLVQALFSACRLSAMWGLESKLTADSVTGLAAAARAAAEGEMEAVLRFSNEMVYLHDQRLRIDFAGFMAFRHVQERATRCGIGEIRISPDALPSEYLGLLRVLSSRPTDAHHDASPAGVAAAYAASLEILQAAGVDRIAIGPPCEPEVGHGELGPQDVDDGAAEAYFRLLYEAAQCTSHEGTPRKAAPRGVKRLVHRLIDVLLRSDRAPLALCQVKNYHGFATNHAANVCVMATALALRIGAHKRLAADVGIAGFLHEATAPPESPAAPGVRGPRAADSRRGRVARSILLDMGFDDASVRAVTTAHALHTGCASGGGPDTPLVRRLVEAVCFYDTMTTPAGDACPAHAPREVLAVMGRDTGGRFDPAIVRALRAMVGPYPFGTVVDLDGGERAVVVARNKHFEQPLRPIVRVIFSPREDMVPVGEEIDLSRFDPGQKRFVRSITTARAPCDVFDQPSEYVKVLGL